MKILAQIFKASLSPAPTVLVISTARAFVEKSTGIAYLAGEIARIVPTILPNGDLSIPEIDQIPATDDADIADLFYAVELRQGTGAKAQSVPFVFDDDDIPVASIRVPQTVNGAIGWNELRTNDRASCPAPAYRADYLDSEQQFNTFLLKSEFLDLAAELTSIAAGIAIDGGSLGADNDGAIIDGGSL